MEAPKINSNKQKLSRRSFLSGLVASGATMGVMGKVATDKWPEQNDATDDIELNDEVSDRLEGDNNEVQEYDEKSKSGYFNYEVEQYSERYLTEIDTIMSRQEVLSVIKANFRLNNIDSAVIRTELTDLILGMAIEESRLDVTAVSQDGAVGCLQIMPNTWADLAKEGESIESLEDNIKVATRLIEQTYRHITSTCQSELEYIKNNFFAGNTADFEKMFLTPVICNAYNSGMGTMANLISWFVNRIPNAQATQMVFEQSETLTGYDVFISMSHLASLEGVVNRYGKDSISYTPKSYGALKALNIYLSKLSN